MAVKIWTSDIKSAYIWTTAIKSIYVGTTKVRPKEREPDPSRTLLYLPLNSTDLWADKSGNYRSVSTTWSYVRYWTYGGVDCAYIYSSSKLSSSFTLPKNLTILCWIYYNWGSWSKYIMAFNQYQTSLFNATNSRLFLTYYNSSSQSTNQYWTFTSSSVWKWSLFVLRHSNNWATRDEYLINPSETTTINITNWQTAAPWSYVYVWNTTSWSSSIQWYMSRYIVENYAWTDDEITAYYNQTKSNYGY